MREISATIFKSFVMAVVAVCLANCGGEKGHKYRIGVAQCSADPWRWETNDEIERELMFHDNAEVEIRCADDIDQKQIADIRYFIDNDFDLIIVNLTKAEAVTPVVKEAFDKGIPVVTFDRRVNGDCYTAHIEVDNELIGREAAEYAISLFPHGSKIIEIQGDSSMTSTVRRHKGFADVIDNAPGQEIVASVYGKWNPDTAAMLIDGILAANPDIDLIYAHSDAMAISAAETARKRGLDNIRVLGIDGLPNQGIKAVADGVLDATFLYPTYGYTLLRIAIDILEGKPYPRETVIPPTSAVDSRNADIILQQNATMKEETDKIVKMKGKLDDFWSRHSTQTTLLYATILIAVLLIGVALLLFHMFRLRGRHQRALMEKNRQLEQERDKQKELYDRLDEATNAKLVFFTNISHDLRTPLTLIAEPVEQVASASCLGERERSLMKLARKNIVILRRLIDQILDFRKYENGKLELQLVEADFRQLFADWAESFSTLARKRDISLTVDISRAGVSRMALDVEKIERVFFNLMSNAFKFTPDNGRIHFSCACDEKKMTFYVEDSGCGISREDSKKVFDRFFQADKVRPTGSGIGLALAKAFVELHGGVITLDSEVGRGSRFTVTIPVTHVAVTSSVPAVDLQVPEEDEEIPSGTAVAADNSKPLLLAIDDNKDILKMIEMILGSDYNIITASNGRQGVKLAARHIPDIIICDVMMPVMDGLECCRILKQELSTSHIPVLMLTACSMDEQRIQGYESGVDAYIPKPFTGEMLLTRCRNLLDNRRRIHDLYANPAGVAEKPRRDTSDASLTVPPAAIDSDFYAEFLRITGENMSNRDFGVDAAASMMGLGQSQFSRKIKALTNYSPVELIRNLRLRQARVLLMSTDKSISEIAYEVGFTTPAYFSKCYRDAYGEAPSDLRSRINPGT